MPARWIHFSLVQLALLVALVGLLVSAGILLWQPRGTPEPWVSAIAFSPDGKTLAASLFVFHKKQTWSGVSRQLGADASQSIRLFDLAELPHGQLLDHADLPGVISVSWPVRKMGLEKSLAFSPDGRRLAIGDLKDTVSIWSIASGQRVRMISSGGPFSGAVGWADDGTLLAAAEHGCMMVRGDTSPPSQVTSQFLVGAVAISRYGNRLATADHDGKIELWDVGSMTRLHVLQPGNNPFDKAGLAISPDGTLVAGSGVSDAGDEAAVRVWVTDSGEQRFSRDLRRPVMAVAFSPDGTKLAVAGQDTLYLFDLDDNLEHQIVTDAFVAAIAFSPDGRLLATGDSRGQLCLWDVPNAKCVQRITMYHAAFSGWPVLGLASLLWSFSWWCVSRRQPRSQA